MSISMPEQSEAFLGSAGSRPKGQAAGRPTGETLQLPEGHPLDVLARDDLGGQIFVGAAPFLLANVLVLTLICLFPELVLWIPGALMD